MVEEKSNVESGETDAEIAFGVHEGDIREVTSLRKIGQYSYRLVYTQKSVRMLDLRLDIAELGDITCLRELLDGASRDILKRAVFDALKVWNIMEVNEDSFK